jgi:hypothetical protein
MDELVAEGWRQNKVLLAIKAVVYVGVVGSLIGICIRRKK